MSNRCPKCNTKLSPLYMKQNCPECGTNIVYYDLDNRLQADHEKAMKEQEAVDKIINNIKTSTIGGVFQIVRLVLMFSPLLWMCLPMFKASDREYISLINLILGIINGSLSFDTILADKSYLFPIITMACVIIFSLPVIISTLFSVGEKALKRNMIFSLINITVFLILTILASVYDANLTYGWIAVKATYIIIMGLHKHIHKKLNK